MAQYDYCSSCGGHGSFPCFDCPCPNCGTSGKVTCNQCTRGYIPCSYCNSTGVTKIEKWIFFTSSISCPQCNGATQLRCATCNGQGSVKCYRCMGSGYLEKCPKCNDKREIKCKVCDGTGKVESAWYKSLCNMSVERLQFEYEKRQHEIQNLEIRMDRLSRNQEELYQAYMNFGGDGSGGSPALLRTEKEMTTVTSSLIRLNDELNTIYNVISKKS